MAMTYGTKDYQGLDRFSNFLQSIGEKKFSIDNAIAKHEAMARERANVTNAVRPWAEKVKAGVTETIPGTEATYKAPQAVATGGFMGTNKNQSPVTQRQQNRMDMEDAKQEELSSLRPNKNNLSQIENTLSIMDAEERSGKSILEGTPLYPGSRTPRSISSKPDLSQAKIATPASPATTKRRDLTPAEEEPIAFQAFMQLLEQGTETSIKTAKELADFRFMRGQTTNAKGTLIKSEIFGNKRLNSYGRIENGKEVVTDQEVLDLNPPSTLSLGDRMSMWGQKADITTIEKLRQEYNNARTTKLTIEKSGGGEDAVKSEVAELARTSVDFNNYINANTDKIAADIYMNLDSGVQQKYKRLRDYVLADQQLEGSSKNLEGLGWGVDETGATYKLSEKSKEKVRGTGH